jgi:hypothetical protein
MEILNATAFNSHETLMEPQLWLLQLNQWGPINVSYELNAVAFKIPISDINLYK